MNAVPLSVVCRRTREHVSLRLDDELSQLEERMLASHLARCADCRAFEESVRDFTQEIRSAPLQSPQQPIVVRRTRRVSLTAAQIGVAATLAIAVLGVVSQLRVPESPSPAADGRPATTNLFKTSWQPERELAQIDAAVRAPGTQRPGPLPAI